MNGYYKSKTLAEKAAWDYQANLPEAERFEIVTMCPGFIMGPSICSGDGFSEGWLKKMLDGSFPKVPRTNFSFVDVRDVALAHLKGIELAEAANKRFLLSGGDY